MAIIKCKMCGGDLNLIDGASTAECIFCGSVQTIPNLDDEKKLIQFERAERLRKQCEFDKAAGIYETIVADFRQEAEAYWGLVLCKYGIEYVDDPATGKKIPTCHRSSFDSIMDDSDLEQALENADPAARKVYREEAKAIEEIRKGIIAVSANEEPYDIFICYKETAEDGDRTLDSVLAQDVYDALTDKGYRVFFSRITLEDKLGQEYEPYIFAALNSAKIMLAFGTDYEYFNAVWVKNEWSRYLKLMAKDKDKHLIPCYKGIDAYDMPKEFAKLQAQDLGKVGAVQDLLRGIEKLIPRQLEANGAPISVGHAANPSVSPLLERAFMFLEDGDWNNASTYCERVLDLEPKNAMAYLGKMLTELHVTKVENLVNLPVPFDKNNYYDKVMRFADVDTQNTLAGYIAEIKDRNEKVRLNSLYSRAKKLVAFAMEKHEQTQEQVKKAYEAAEIFNQLNGYKDSAELAVYCVNLGKQITYAIGVRALENAASEYAFDQAAALFEKLGEYEDAREKAAICHKRKEIFIIEAPYYEACEKMDRVSSREGYLEAAEMFKKLGDHRDSKERLTLCLTKAEESRKEGLYSRAIREKEKHNTTGYIGAISLFEAISGFKDADEQCAECQKLLTGIRQQARAETVVERSQQNPPKDFAAEQKKKEAERAAQQRREENERIAMQQRGWRNAGRCQHCGGELKGFFSKKCVSCGKIKDY